MKQEFSFLEKKKKGGEKESKNKRKNKTIKSEEKSWPKEDQDSYYHQQKEKLKVSFKHLTTVRTEFNAARRTYLDSVLFGLNTISEVSSSLFQFKGNGGRTSGATFPMKKNFAGVKVIDDCGAVALTNEEVRMIFRESHRRSRSKLLQFWDNRRPPYWGTWGKASHFVGPRRPFGKEKTLDFNADSDDEWQKKTGEITISDSEEGEESEPANNNNFKIDTVSHAEYLTEIEMLRREYERQKKLQMMSLLASFQCVSEEQPNDDLNPKPQGGVLPEPSGVEGLSIGNKRRRDESDGPGSAQKRKPSKLNPENAHLFALSSKRLICEESIPALICFVHGSTCSKLKTVKKFQSYLARIIPVKNVPCQSRVLAKFGEIAALDKCTEDGPLNGKMCYFVHEDVLERYNLSDLSPIRHEIWELATVMKKRRLSLLSSTL